MVTFTINIPPMLAYIPYMDPMGMEKSWVPQTSTSTTSVSDRARRHSANHEIRCPRHKWWGPGRIFTSKLTPMDDNTINTHLLIPGLYGGNNGNSTSTTFYNNAPLRHFFTMIHYATLSLPARTLYSTGSQRCPATAEAGKTSLWTMWEATWNNQRTMDMIH